jgi:hypothetical protein
LSSSGNEGDSIATERLVTDRCELVPVTADVARRIRAGDYDGLNRGDGWPHPGTEVAVTMLLTSPPRAMWLISVDGRIIGDCGTHGPPDPFGQIEIGYGIAAPYWGFGYGTEAVRALTAWLTHQSGVRSVLARTSTDNAASRRLLVKVGFRLRAESSPDCAYVIDAQSDGVPNDR